jgi:hypothetical protein
MIGERELDEIALADANETSRHIAAERPEQIFHAIGHLLHHFAHFELHGDFRRVFACDWRRDMRRLREHGDFFAHERGIGALGRWAFGFRGVRLGAAHY